MTKTTNPETSVTTTKTPTERWEKVIATCGNCGLSGTVPEMFGIKKDSNGQERKQSWCRACRKSLNK